MSEYLLYNDKFYKAGASLVTADNRGLRYGDGLFETIRYANGEVQLKTLHFERLFEGLKTLAFELPVRFSASHLESQVKLLCKKNGLNNARVRINIFRGNGGLYDAENHFPNTIIQSWALPGADFQLNENGLVAGIYQIARKSMDIFSNLKNNNYLPYAMAALYAKKQQWNDGFVLNTSGRICDSTIANIFIVKNEIVYTCPLQEGCVAGVMRRFLLQNLAAHGFNCQEKNLTEQNLHSADEVFLTNAIKGIRWVSRCGDSSYTNRLTNQIFNKLLKKS